MYAAKPACMEAVQALLEHLDGGGRVDGGDVGGGRWLSWGEVQDIYGGGGVVFTQADAREYARLVRELDGRSLLRGGEAMFDAHPPATIAWRERRVRVESLVLGALSSSPVHRALVLVSGTNIAVLLCC